MRHSLASRIQALRASRAKCHTVRPWLHDDAVDAAHAFARYFTPAPPFVLSSPTCIAEPLRADGIRNEWCEYCGRCTAASLAGSSAALSIELDLRTMTASSASAGTASRSAAHWRRAAVDGPTPLWLSYTDALPAAVEMLVGADAQDECTDADGKGGGGSDAQEHRAASAACGHAVATRLPRLASPRLASPRSPRLRSGLGGRSDHDTIVRAMQRGWVWRTDEGPCCNGWTYALCASAAAVHWTRCSGHSHRCRATVRHNEVSRRRTHKAMYSDE